MDIKLAQNISDISQNHYKYLLSLPNVNGIGLGFKYINDINTLEPCIHVLVEDKISPKYLPTNSLIPSTYMGIKTDVINIGRILPKQNSTSFNGYINSLNTNEPLINPFVGENDIPVNTKKYRPLEAGCGISSFKGLTAFDGTLGCIVTKLVKGKKYFYILTGNHVIGDDVGMSIGSSVIQPSASSGGLPLINTVAKLSDFVKTKFIKGNYKPVNYVDCAIAKIMKKTFISNDIIGLGKIEGEAVAYPGLFVRKSGFMTGVTEGAVTSVDATTYASFGAKEAFYQRQINIKLKADDSDSGSVIVDEYGRVVGLLMSVTDKGFAVANKISLVLDSLKVEIYTGK